MIASGARDLGAQPAAKDLLDLGGGGEGRRDGRRLGLAAASAAGGARRVGDTCTLKRVHEANKVLVCILLAARPEVARDRADVLGEDVRGDRARRVPRVVRLPHMGLQLAVDAEASLATAARVRALRAQVGERRRVGEALERRVHEACVAEVLQPRAHAAQVLPLQQSRKLVGRIEEFIRRQARDRARVFVWWRKRLGRMIAVGRRVLSIRWRRGSAAGSLLWIEHR